jgi:protein arginine N-methyltransferase 1
MLADQVRMETYRKAIHEVVKKDDLVVDIGTGSGILSFFAVQAGAKKVYAIEQGEIIHDAEKLAEANGLKEKIIFIKGISNKVDLPEKVDVITSEIIGFFGLEENLLRFKVDARDRFLKDGGKLVPSWLELFLVPVESEEIWKDNIGLWNKDYYGVDFSNVRKYAVSQRYVIECSGKVNMLAAPAMVAHLDLYQIEKVQSAFKHEYVVQKKGLLHGFVGYFLAGLSSNVLLDTSPEKPRTHWKQIFFPLDNEVIVEKSDRVHFEIKVIPQKQDVFWRWGTAVYRDGLINANFSQSNLDISKEELIVGRMDFRPALTREGEIRRRVFELCDSEKSIKRIAEHLLKEYPDKFQNLKDATHEIVGIVRPWVKI